MEMETYHGHVRSPADAIILFEACRQGLLPRVQRRLSEKERQSIRSGSVFVWDEREAGMRRWTDGKSWSASRVSGSFLTYREMEGKRGGGFPASAKRANSKEGNKDTGSDVDMTEDGPDGYRYKPDGLMKQSFSITTQSGQHLHLISYYARAHPDAPELKQPTQDSYLSKIRPPKGMYPESTVIEQNIPPVTRAPMASSPYTASPQQMPTASSPYQRTNGGAPIAPQTYPYGPPAWPPPSPMATPPSAHAHYSPYQQSGHPPFAHYSPGHPSPLQYAYPHGAPHQPPGPTAFDRPPPPLSHTGLPPPPQGPNGQHPSPRMIPSGGPQYILNTSPRTPQATDAAQQGQQQTPSSLARNPARATPPRGPSTQGVVHQPAGTGVTLQQEPPGEQRQPSKQPSPARAEKRNSQESLPPAEGENTNGNSSKIPSIHSLINGGGNEPSDAKSEGTGSRAGSRSPGSQQLAQDPANPKLGFGEDKRALRVLDKAMMRS
ncbi:MAG: hypothetical protein M1820_007794 [Bogoriella megaspora]|nr:MAG: hypothetical protein M1820_007794 [Bogoriella megaspora]